MVVKAHVSTPGDLISKSIQRGVNSVIVMEISILSDASVTKECVVLSVVFLIHARTLILA